ncbi:MAG: response regulator [Candidatus Margulisbacteria bacterium]|jgi:CheY-like chemotaxis protein|nr:response regulator [Candidatus Margulisiibacteriota bacterium]
MANILVADDEPNILKLISFFLKSLGYTVYGAGSGQEALDFFNADPARVDLVISDLIMPGLSGLELCRELKGRCPVIIVSAMSDDANIARAAEAGAVDFIAKPYDLEQIKLKLPQILQKSGQS